MANMGREIDRILDANLNRVREGLRVVEELGRLVLEDRGLQQSLKAIRHKLAEVEKKYLGQELIQSRSVQRDPGVHSNLAGERRRGGFLELAHANFRRTQEGLRVLEEVSKLDQRGGSGAFKQLRFKLYVLEQTLTERLAQTKRPRRMIKREGRTP
jgi:thiamine-phosphate pyrophosphorylase